MQSSIEIYSSSYTLTHTFEYMYTWCYCKSVVKLTDGFKTQPPVDRRFRPVYIVLNNDNRPEPDGTVGWVLKSFLMECVVNDARNLKYSYNMTH